ncbi:TetR family transcriptional regulator [Arenicella chitinivorans]|uniref:TetR family transcriptional regulator n=1 Tax=Arenicella chitinivorans TaxID=1329800 RepID=A0A918RPE9_9GAMM|nr:TetR family transcriptional regulator [Arenicella chitinivorans]GHA06433.1 TetR family transcriptional regulator [Arenicella chitinivorans]
MSAQTKILNAASELFLTGGVAALSVRAIAKQAGLSTIGIYSHFQGKQGILDALYIEGFELVSAAMSVAEDENVTLEHVLAAARGYLRVAKQHEAHYRLIFGEADAGYEPSERARAAAETAFGSLVSHLGLFLQTEKLQGDRWVLAMDVWAILHGYVSIVHHTHTKPKWDWQTMAINAVKHHLSALKPV